MNETPRSRPNRRRPDAPPWWADAQRWRAPAGTSASATAKPAPRALLNDASMQLVEFMAAGAAIVVAIALAALR